MGEGSGFLSPPTNIEVPAQFQQQESAVKKTKTTRKKGQSQPPIDKKKYSSDNAKK